MGFWPLFQYEEYVKNHSSGVQRMELLHGRGEPFDDKYSNIFLGNVPLPRWMSESNIISLNDRDISFASLLAMYQGETRVHVAAVRGWLEQLKRRATGLALLAEIDSSGWSVTIVPYRGRRKNADAETRSGYASVGAARKGALVDPMFNPFEDDARFGTGSGANSLVRFSADMWRGPGMRGPGNAPDEVLYHELVHASRQMRGVMNATYVNRDYDNQEEYLAVALTNIYLSDKGQTVLVGDHDVGTLKGAAADHFIDNSQDINLPPMQLMQIFKDGQPHFYNVLAHLPPDRPKRNWVRQHFERQQDDFMRHGHDRSTF